MNRIFNTALLSISLLITSSCKINRDNINKPDEYSYLTNFEMVQQRADKINKVIISSPKAILNPTNNQIDIIRSNIEIINNNGKKFNIKSGKALLDNSNKQINISKDVTIIGDNYDKSYIKTNSLTWNLEKSSINIQNDLTITLKNTKIYSINGFYDLNKGRIDLNSVELYRDIFNKNGFKSHSIIVLADRGNWVKENNDFKFTSGENQVETTVKFLRLK